MVAPLEGEAIREVVMVWFFNKIGIQDIFSL